VCLEPKKRKMQLSTIESRPAVSEGWLVGVDSGGTFTDIVLERADGTERIHVKVPSEPSSPATPIVSGLIERVERLGLSKAAIATFAHGTTVGTNALIQRSGRPVVLLTTRGFRDLLEIGRQIRPHVYDLQLDAPSPLVPRQQRLEVEERITSGGIVITPLDTGEIDKVCSEVDSISKDSPVAVCFLFAHENPEHEAAIGAALQSRGRRFVSLSHKVSPAFREYERLSTVVANAFLQPTVSAYLNRLSAALSEAGIDAPVWVNQSSGGLAPLQDACDYPVRTALSGPAAGVVAATRLKTMLGLEDVITLDIGGTSADVAFIGAEGPGMSAERSVAGFPIRIPGVDIHTVGAGGGSVAKVEMDGLLRVGPESAGSDPGPACYGKGGTRATVTDANLLLRRLSPRGLLGGIVPLQADAAEAVVGQIAAGLGMPLMTTAVGIIDIMTTNMVHAIRVVSTEQGRDPRKCTLVAFGGAGPLHAAHVAWQIGIREVIIPHDPGLVCAQGLLASPQQQVFVRPLHYELDASTIGHLIEDHRILQAEVQHWLEHNVETNRPCGARIELDLRYVGQNYEISLPIEGEAIESYQALLAAFMAEHDRLYGYGGDGRQLECTALRAFGSIALRADPKQDSQDHLTEAGPSGAPIEIREVYFGSTPRPTSVFRRTDLKAGQVLRGPAVIEQYDSTTLIWPSDVAEILSSGVIRIRIGEAHD
jgi:N-methylhydantoinase A